MVTPLMRLQNPDYTRIILVTLPGNDAGVRGFRASGRSAPSRVEPYAWVINRTLARSGTKDPLLLARLPMEHAQTERVRRGLAKRVFELPWQAAPPVGITTLSRLVAIQPQGG